MEQGQAETVLLVHGLARSTGSLRIFAWRARAAGLETADAPYPSRRLRIEEAVAHIARHVERVIAERGGKVHLVGHSLGGLLALKVKRARPDLPIHRVVQLGTPNRGSPLAEALRERAVFRRFFGPVLTQLAEDQTAGWQHDPDVLAFAGVEIPPKLSRRYGLYGPNDGMVSVRSAWGRDAGVRQIADTFHGGMPLSRSVARRAIAFLKTGRPDA